MTANIETLDAPGSIEHYDVIILGAGVTGLVSASILTEGGDKRILVVDEYGHIGGNHIDRAFGRYTFDVGSFIFQDDSPLLAHFPELLPRYIRIFPSWGKLTPSGVVTDYPLSLKHDVLAHGPTGVARILSSVLYARLFQRNVTNARDFARFWIGENLLRRSGLDSYLARFYGAPPEKIDLEFAQKRMRWISENASVRAIARRLVSRPAPPTNTQLARPREGFAHLYAAAKTKLEQQGATFLLGARLKTLTRRDATFSLQVNDRIVTADRVVSTIPIQRIQEVCGIAPSPFQTITLLSLFFSFAGQRGFEPSIIYNFSHQGDWKRITVYSDFYGAVDGREYFTAEVMGHDGEHAVPQAEGDFRSHVAANRLFAGDLRLEGSFALGNAYPVYMNDASGRASDAIRALRDLGVESFGRQGGFNYQPTARVSTIEAQTALRWEGPS